MKINVNGVKSTQDALEREKQNLLKKIKRQVVDSTVTIHSQAVDKVAVDLGSLKQSGNFEFEKEGLRGKVFFSSFHAGFVEFGTGTKVEIPQGWADEASKFKSQSGGDWKDFESIIQGWMLRKGIDLKYTYAIMMHIYRVGTTPQPFLIPAFNKESVRFQKELERILTQYKKTI